jgi:hypothetical protein
MNQRFNFQLGSTPEQQLLAISIVLLQMLRKHRSLTLYIPASVHHALSKNSYGLLLYDTLSAEHADLEARLQLKVHSANHFDIVFSS